MNELIRINNNDMVAVALTPLKSGSVVPVAGDDCSITLTEDITMGHKVALRDIKEGEPVIKYGFPIGQATTDIKAGSHIHTHNLRTLLRSGLTYTYNPAKPALQPQEHTHFKGYARADGRVGIRNELWIIPTVGCVNDIAEALARKAQSLVGG